LPTAFATISRTLCLPSTGLSSDFLRGAKIQLDEKGNEYCKHILNASEQIVGLVEKIYTFISAKETPCGYRKSSACRGVRVVREEFGSQFDLGD
jgi:hypothetical protein